MGLILTIIAYLLLLILAIPAIIVGAIISLFQHTGNKYFKNTAIALDQLGNVICQHLFNLCLITNTGYKFGNVDETVSSVLGKNHKTKTCTKLGFLICLVLNLIEKNHVQISIDNSIK